MEIKVEIPKGKKPEWKKVDGNLALVLVDEEPEFSYKSIKTYADACAKLGINADAFNVSCGGDKQAQRQVQALYKLLIIQKAINHSVSPDKNGWTYNPYWILYTKDEMKRMSEKEKLSKGIKHILSCTCADLSEYYGVGNLFALNRNSEPALSFSFPLCFNSEEAALYAAKQFESLFFDYYGIKVKEFRFKLEANMVHHGDIVHASDDSLIKIHHIGAEGEVYYEAYADNARGQLQYEPYTYHYGFITDCYPATEKQKRWLRKWIKKHEKKEEKV